MRSIFVPLSLVVLLLVAVPATAVAANSAQNAYSEAGPLNSVSESAPGNESETGTEPEAAAASTSPSTSEETSSSVLPFTGEDLAIVLLLGVGLLGLGLLIRRVNGSTSA